MKETMKFYRNDPWLAFPLWLCGGLGVLGVLVCSHF